MAQGLALTYRPRRFDDLVGQRAVQVILRQMVTTNQVPAVMLFDGVRGTGKTTTARILAAALNCETGEPCGTCPSCKAVYDGTSLDVIEIDAASNGLVDDIRQLRNQLLYRVEHNHRVILLDEAHSMSTAAFNALLKTIEEPPLGTVFILLTTEPHRIPDTVVSRCMPFTFRRISVNDITGRLQHICQQENLTAQPELLHHIAERSDGGMRDAIMTLDQVTRVGISTVEQFTDLMGETDFAPDLLDRLINADIAGAFGVLTEQMTRTGNAVAITGAIIATLRDLLILRTGGDIAATGAARTARTTLAQATDPASIVTALKVLWELKTKVRLVDDPRSALDLALVMISEAFTKTTAAPATPTGPRTLSLADMAALRNRTDKDRHGAG